MLKNKSSADSGAGEGIRDCVTKRNVERVSELLQVSSDTLYAELL